MLTPTTRLVRLTRAATAEQWSIVNHEEERLGEISMVWGDPHPYCLIVLDEQLSGERGGWEQVVWRLEQEVLLEEPGVINYSVWQKGFVGEYYRCADCGELHSQYDEDPAGDLWLDFDDEDD